MITPAMALEAPNLDMTIVSYTPEPVRPGQAFDIVLEISNSGDKTDNVWVEIVEDYPFTVLQGGDYERAKNLRVVSGTQKLQFRVAVDESAQDGLTPLRVRFSDSKIGYREMDFNIQVETFGARIGIDKVKQVPSKLMPGQKGKIYITLTNLDDQPLDNVDTFLDLTNTYDSTSNMDNTLAVQAMINARLEDVNRRIAAGMSPLAGATPMGVSPATKYEDLTFKSIAPVGSTTLKRTGELIPGESVIVEYEIQALPDITPGIYAIGLFVNYNDEDNNPFHTKTELPVTIDMPSEPFVQLKSSSLRSTDFAGDITILLANRGLSDIRYASIELLDTEQLQLITAPNNVYVGTLNSGESAEATFNVLPHEENLKIPIRVTYRDSYNNAVEIKEDLHLEIINRNYYRDMPYEMMLPWIILGIVFLILTWYFLSRLKK